MTKPLLNVIFWTWCLPQTLLGFLLYATMKIASKGKYKEIGYKAETKILLVRHFKLEAISLGKYIICGNSELNSNSEYISEMFRHEYGHTLQGFITGWLYLIVVGIPGFSWACLKQIGFFKKKDYYSFYTETWANKLAGVDITKL